MGGRDSPTCFWAVWQNTWSDRDLVPCWWSAEPLTPRLLRRMRCRSSHEQETSPPCRRSGREGTSMYDITIDDFPPDRLAAIVHWRNDPAVNRYLRQGILTLEDVQAWYTQYFSRAEHQLFAVYADKALIGYGTLSHIDPTHRSGEIGIVIGEKQYWHKG